MDIRGDGLRAANVKQWVLRLLLLSFVLRALIPLGFMPDAASAAKGVFKVVICSVVGMKTVTLDETGKPVQSHDELKHDQPCAFAALATVALPSFEIAGAVLPDPASADVIAPLAVQLPPARAGPALGSRGPPILS